MLSRTASGPEWATIDMGGDPNTNDYVDTITEPKLAVNNSPSDGQVLTWDDTNDYMECGDSGAVQGRNVYYSNKTSRNNKNMTVSVGH